MTITQRTEYVFIGSGFLCVCGQGRETDREYGKYQGDPFSHQHSGILYLSLEIFSLRTLRISVVLCVLPAIQQRTQRYAEAAEYIKCDFRRCPMFIRSLLVAVVILLFTSPAFSQFG